MPSVILGVSFHRPICVSTTYVIYRYSGMEELDGNYDSDEDADFTKMDMVKTVLLHKPDI